jgi:hypothetical protein
MAFNKINNLFESLMQFYDKNMDDVEWNWVEERFAVGGVRANVVRAFTAYRDELSEAREEVKGTITGNVKEEERAWLRLDWCENFLARTSRGVADAPKAPGVMVGEMPQGWSWHSDEYACATVMDRFAFARLFPREVNMREVNPALRAALDALLMADGRVFVPLREMGGMNNLVVRVSLRNGDMLWTADGTLWRPVFSDEADDDFAGNNWGKWVRKDGPVVAQAGAGGAGGDVTFAEEALEEMRKRHYRVDVLDGQVMCRVRWVQCPRSRGKVILEGFMGERDEHADAVEADIAERSRARAALTGAGANLADVESTQEAGKRKRDSERALDEEDEEEEVTSAAKRLLGCTEV